MSLRRGWVVLKSLKTPLRNIKMVPKVKFARNVRPDRIKSKNPTNASKDKGKNLLEVPSFRKLDVTKLSELVDLEDKIV